jgi:hypothetical protein
MSPRHSDSGGTAGSVVSDLDVPDFYKQPLAMSGLTLISGAGSQAPTARVTDAALFTENEISVVFSFARSYFFVESERPREIDNDDLKEGIELKEVPTGKVDRSMGDVHGYGNPHFTLSPQIAQRMAVTLVKAMCQADPSNTDLYKANAKKFVTELADVSREIRQELAPYAGLKVVTFHKAWEYFADAFDITVVTWGNCLEVVQKAAAHHADRSSIEIIDLISLVPQPSQVVTIANFNLGRSGPGLDSIALVEIDGPISESVLGQIRKLPLVKQAKALAF